MKNYSSATIVAEELQQQFEAEEALGMMSPTILAKAKAAYPGARLRIAARGALQKADGSWRPLHDATHGFCINPEIKVRDQIEYVGLADEATAMEISKRDCSGAFFQLASDVRKAHRRVLHAEEDWG